MKTREYGMLDPIVRQKATFHTETGKFKGNPFVEALPEMIEGSDNMIKHYCDVLPFGEADKWKSDGLRREMLMDRVRSVFFPLESFTEVCQRIQSLIRNSYSSFLPDSFIRDENTAIRDIKKNRKQDDPAYSFLLTGYPGTGKSTMIKNILLDYPDLIDHGGSEWCNGDIKQIPVIQIQCPPVQSFKKGFWKRILNEIDRILGNPPSTYTGKDATDLEKLVRLRITTYKIGLIIIDEIGKILNADSKTVDEYLTNVFNSITCSIVFVGNANTEGLFKRELFSARRSESHGEKECLNLKEDSKYWIAYSDAIWNALQITRTKTDLDEEMRHLMYEATQGYPYFYNEVYLEMQILAMKDKPDERITVDHLKRALETTKRHIAEKMHKIEGAEAFDVLSIPDVFNGKVDLEIKKKPKKENADVKQLEKAPKIKDVKNMYKLMGFDSRFMTDQLEEIAADYIEQANLKLKKQELMEGAIAFINQVIREEEEVEPALHVEDLDPLDFVAGKES